MANPNEKTPGSVAGAYYVDTSCIDCDLCRNNAPTFFMRNDGEGLSYVHHQPETPEEEIEAEEALLGCPSESIGRDGVVPLSRLAGV